MHTFWNFAVFRDIEKEYWSEIAQQNLSWVEYFHNFQSIADLRNVTIIIKDI